VTAKPKIILCLEDTPSRVRWLEGIAKKHGATVYATAWVTRFLEACRAQSAVAELTIVLDHDLGGFSMPVSLQDADGLDGIDAVEQMPLLVAPVLIWSTNHIEAPRMEETLRFRGFSTVVRMPWSSDRDDMAAQLHEWLS
jgi:CheY-like chemotaxis protein